MTLQRVKTPLGGAGGGQAPTSALGTGAAPREQAGGRNRHPLFRAPAGHRHSLSSHGGVPKPEWGGGREQPDTPCQPPPGKERGGIDGFSLFSKGKQGRGDKLRGRGGCVCA